MKKLSILLLLTVCISSISFAQKFGRTRFSIGPEIGLAASNPLKNIPNNKGWGFGIGASAQAEHFFRESLAGLVSVGVITYSGRASGTTQNNKAYTAIPLRVGANFYAGNRIHAGAQIGAGLNSMAGVSQTTFAYSPQVGYQFSRNDKPLDLSVKYDGYAGKSHFSAWGLRLSLIL